MNAQPRSRSSAARRIAGSLTLAAIVVLSPTHPAHAQTGTPTALYHFTGGTDGEDPIGGVVADANFTLYGETFAGGTTSCTSKYEPARYGCGTIYSFNQQTGFKTLATFTGPNGAHGSQTLTLVGSTLYGTTYAGGASDDGIVFSISTDGTNFTVLHQFNGNDGKYPSGILRNAGSGLLYGITAQGGTANAGVIFSITPDGTYTLLHSFTGGKGGRDPQSMLISPGGELVGSTLEGGQPNGSCNLGCGTVFTFQPGTGAFRAKYKFNTTQILAGDIGSIGPGPTTFGANFYNIYSIDSKGSLANLAAFNTATEGGIGSGPLLLADGSLIGVTGNGPFIIGGLYKVANGVYTELAVFEDGTNPVAQPIVTSTGTIIGTASQNGLCAGCGTIWQYTP